MAAELIYVVCDQCGRPFPSGVAATMEALESGTFRNNKSQCSHCGNMVLWSKAEVWPESVLREKFPKK